jgi:hypothetical protein
VEDEGGKYSIGDSGEVRSRIEDSGEVRSRRKRKHGDANLIRTREAELALLQSAGHRRQMPGCALAFTSYTGHFRVLLQFFLSFAANVVDPWVCSLLVVVSTPAEVAELKNVLAEENTRRTECSLLKLSSCMPQLTVVLPRLTIVDFPAIRQQLSPAAKTELPSAKNVGAHGRLYVCAKKAYAARYAHEVLDAVHVIVTDSEAYVWKALSLARLFGEAAARPTVWYSDAPVHAKQPRRERADAPAPIDTTWCSQHVYGDMRGQTRGAVRERSPSPTAKYFEHMLFFYPRDALREYWDAVERAWKAPWYDAIVAAHEAEPRCIDVGFWLEVSWHLFLYEHHRPRVAFRNVTAAIEDAFGHPFVRANSYVHARFELLWRALTNQTLPAYRTFYRTAPLPLFRFEFRQRGNCLPLKLVAELPPAVAGLQANSAVPNWVFEGRCARELALLEEARRNGTQGSSLAALPWVPHGTKTRR